MYYVSSVLAHQQTKGVCEYATPGIFWTWGSLRSLLANFQDKSFHHLHKGGRGSGDTLLHFQAPTFCLIGYLIPSGKMPPSPSKRSPGKVLVSHCHEGYLATMTTTPLHKSWGKRSYPKSLNAKVWMWEATITVRNERFLITSSMSTIHTSTPIKSPSLKACPYSLPDEKQT